MINFTHGSIGYHSRLQKDTNHCHLCGKPFAYGDIVDLHHVFNGAFRHKSEVDGFVVLLHRKCHEKVHESQAYDVELKQEAEMEYLEEYIDGFRKKYGRNYL